MPPTTRISRSIADHVWVLSLAWMLLVAMVYASWATGGPALLPAGFDVRGHLPLLAVDLVAIPLCLVGAVVVWLLRPDQPASRLRSRWWVRPPAAFGAALMLAHVASGVVRLTLGSWFGHPADDLARMVFWLYEPYWLLGGVLLALTLHGHGRARRSALRPTRTSAADRQVPVPGLGAVGGDPAERGVEAVGASR